MSDKDQFTFEDDDDNPETNQDDQIDLQSSEVTAEEFPDLDLNSSAEPQGLGLDYDDDFPETDLSAAFSEGEHAMDDPALAEPVQNVKGGGSKTRSLLLVLLLVIAGGAGGYYFMGLGGSTPPETAVPVPAQKAKKSVALPAKPAPKAAPQAKVEPVAKSTAKTVVKPASVAVPSPPPTATPATKAVKNGQPAAKPEGQVSTAAKADGKPVSTKPVAKPAPASQKAVVAAPAVKTEEPQKVAAVTREKVGGAFALDAGSYLLAANRDALVAKIKKLGYEPFVTPVDATLNMTRLRLGTFSKNEVQEALDFARSIEPGAYSAPAGDGYVIYAGTFLQKDNIDKLSQRFLKEGIKVRPEPVQVVRSLNRVRFGSFTTKQDASDAAQKIAEAGIKAQVVKFK